MPYAIIAAVFLLFLTVSFIGGLYMYRFAIVRDKKTPDWWTHPEKLEPPQHMTPENAAIVTHGRQWILAHASKPYYRVSRDGVTLACRMIHPTGIWTEQPRGIVLCCHGYRSHAVFDFAGAAEWLCAEGFSLCLIDQRACGSSGGKFVTFGVREKDDVVDWACWLVERYPDLPVLLDGVSMGSSTVLAASGEPLPPNVRAIVADCGYTSAAGICKKVLRQWFHLPPFPLYYAALCVIWLRAGVWLPDLDCADAVTRNRLPLLIAHGKADDFVPFSMGEQLYAAAKDHCDAEFFAVEGAPHGQSWLYDTDGYKAALRRLLYKAGLD